MDAGNMHSEGLVKLWSVSTKFAREMMSLHAVRPGMNAFVSYIETLTSLTDNTIKVYGSRGEGMWYPFPIVENRDVDVVSTYPETIAVETDSQKDPNDQEMYVYLVDREGCLPGYCRLRQLHQGSSLFHTNKEFNGRNYLLNTCPKRVQEIVEICRQDIYHYLFNYYYFPNSFLGPMAERGPSISREFRGINIQSMLINFAYNITKNDNVYVISHPEWPSCASEWKERIRCYGWPSQQQITNITNKGIYLAPVGSTQSKVGDIEWRYSFNEAEKDLVRSFNSTQINCYVLLKMLVSEYITPHFCDDVISSYHLKTLMFWAEEQTDPQLWVSRNLVELLFRILNVLLNSVTKLSCPSYFIPDENLFAGKITPVNREHVSQILLKVLSEGWVALTRLKHFAKNEDFVQSLYEVDDLVDYRKLKGIRICDELITKIIYFFASGHAVFCIYQLLYPIFCCSLIETDKIHASFKEVINKLLQRIHFSDNYINKETLQNILAFVRSIYGTHFLSLSRCPNLQRTDNCIMEKIGLVYSSHACKSNLVECIAKHANYTYMTGDFISTIEAANQLVDRYERFPLQPPGVARNIHALFNAFEATIGNAVIYEGNVFDLFDKHCFLGWIIFLENEIYALPGDARVELFYVSSTGNQLQTRCRNLFGLSPFVYVVYLALLINIGRGFEYEAKVYLKIMKIICGNSNSYDLSSINLLGACYVKLGQHEKAIKMFRTSLKRQRDEINAAVWYVARLLWRKLRDRWTETS